MGWTSWWSQIVYSPGNLPIPVNQSGNSLIKSSVDLMDLSAVAVGAGAGLRGLVSGWATVTAQFIFTTANSLHDERPRMVGPGVSVTYQYECTLWGWVPGPPGCQVMGPWSAPYKGKWDLLYAVSLVLTWSRLVAGQLDWSSLGRDIWIHRGQHITSRSSVDFDTKWGCSLSAGTAGSCTVVYTSLHHWA